jgi:hypothetical protein
LRIPPRRRCETTAAAKRALARGSTNVRAPVTGLWYDSWDNERTEQAKRWACAALAARARFKKENPAWPDLPVSEAALDRLQADLAQQCPRDPRKLLLLEFALSQRDHLWDPQHPRFRAYACSVMAHKRAPDTIREDDELKKEFPPQPLIELFERLGPPGIILLQWRSPLMIAQDQALERFHEGLAQRPAETRELLAEYRREIARVRQHWRSHGAA